MSLLFASCYFIRRFVHRVEGSRELTPESVKELQAFSMPRLMFPSGLQAALLLLVLIVTLVSEVNSALFVKNIPYVLLSTCFFVEYAVLFAYVAAHGHAPCSWGCCLFGHIFSHSVGGEVRAYRIRGNWIWPHFRSLLSLIALLGAFTFSPK